MKVSDLVKELNLTVFCGKAVLHTCLSPCGSLEMSPWQIVETALEQGLDAIAVTDHNSTLQCPEIQALGEECGLVVFDLFLSSSSCNAPSLRVHS